MILYQNYHRHTQQTNPLVPDSTASNEQYAIRAQELGHGIISSCEHGYQGRYIECYNLAKQYGLKFVQVAEAYWVKDRNPSLADKSNCHIIIAALNEAGRRDMNRVLSEANRSGFYIRPRVDMELLTSLNPSNVIITTACIGYWKYDDAENLMLKMHQHFGNHFYLEVQCHNTESQRHLNSRIKKLHYKYKIPLIFGCDSHYIHPEDAKERDDFLYSKDMHYEDEEGWYLDYVDGETIYDRFVKQGVLSHDEIMEAMNNTNIFLQVEEYDCPIFNQEIKLPSLYPDWTQEQKDAEYTRLIWERWDEYSKQIPVHKHPLYQKEIQREIDIVVESHMADYFILNYYIIKRGKELGGVITSSGRGSAVSFITNRLLGFTEVDRISAHVEMYPERFMSATRILETGSLPDYNEIIHLPPPNKYYVYEWYFVNTNEVFYIGKGCGKRFKEIHGRNKFFQCMYKSHSCAVRIIMHGFSEVDAYQYERYVIQYYKKFTTFRLTNQTEGGDGTVGYKFSDEQYQHMLETRRDPNGVYKSDAFRAKISSLVQGENNPNFGHRWSNAQKDALSKKQSASGRYKDTKNPTATRIQCVETGEVFDCIKFAMQQYDVKYPASFSVALDNPKRTAAGLHWVRVL